MSDFLPQPWFARGRWLRRSREIASARAQRGLGWLVTHGGSGNHIPFERWWCGQQVGQADYRPGMQESNRYPVSKREKSH